MKSIISILQNQLAERFLSKSFESCHDKQKSDFVLFILTLLASLIIIILISLLIATTYQVDEKQLLNELSGLFLEKYRFALWPEPVERAQYLVTIIFAPLIAFVTYYLFSKKINRVSGAQLNVIYYFLFLLSALLILLLIDFDLKLNPDNFIVFESRPYYRDIRNFVVSIIAARPIYLAFLTIPFVLFFMQFKSKGRVYHFIKIAYYIMLSALLIDVFLITIFNRDNYFGSYDHFNAVYYSVAQVVNGKTLLVDFTNQYGLYPHFLLPIFKCIGLNVLNYSIVMALLVVFSYVCLLVFMKNTIKSIFLLCVGFVGLVYLRGYFLNFFNYGDTYFQYTPIRFIFPCFFLLLASIYFKSFSRTLYFVIFAIASTSVLWNVDSGVVVFLSWLAVLCFYELFNFERSVCLKNCFTHLLHGLMIFASTILIYSILIYARSGVFPDYSLLIKSQKIFFVSGFYMMHMPIFNAWNLIALLYGIGLVQSVKSIIKNEKTHKNIIIFLLSILGIGLFSYYQGRSHDFNLFVVNYPAFILLVIYADSLVSEIRTYGFKLLPKTFYLSLILFFLLTFFYSFIAKFDLIYQMSTSRLPAITGNLLPNAPLTENIDFLKDNTGAGEDILILTNSLRDGIYYGETGTTNAANVPGFSELMLQEDQDKIYSFLKANEKTKVFVTSDVDDNTYSQILRERYSFIDQSKEMKFYLPKRSAYSGLIPDLIVSADYLRISPQADLVKNLTTFPATLPLVEIQLELTESKILDSVRVLALGGGEWITSPINQGLWGVAVIDKVGGVYKVMNEGPRKEKMNIPISRFLTLWIPNNGDLSKCPELKLKLLFSGGERVNTIASCKLTKSADRLQPLSPYMAVAKNDTTVLVAAQPD